MAEHEKVALLELSSDSDESTERNPSAFSDSTIDSIMDSLNGKVDRQTITVQSASRESLNAVQTQLTAFHDLLREQYRAILVLSPEKILIPIAQASYFSTSKSQLGDTGVLFASEESKKLTKDIHPMSINALNKSAMSGRMAILGDRGLLAIPTINDQNGEVPDLIGTWDESWRFTERKPSHCPPDVPEFECTRSVQGVVKAFSARHTATESGVDDILGAENVNIAGAVWYPDPQDAERVYEQVKAYENPSLVISRQLQKTSDAVHVALSRLSKNSSFGAMLAALMSRTNLTLQEFIDRYHDHLRTEVR